MKKKSDEITLMDSIPNLLKMVMMAGLYKSLKTSPAVIPKKQYLQLFAMALFATKEQNKKAEELLEAVEYQIKKGMI